MRVFKFNQKPANELVLDPGYYPIILGNIAFEETVMNSDNPCLIKIAFERSDRQIASVICYVFNEKYNQEEENFMYVERLIKTLLWLKGAFRIYIGGNEKIGRRISDAYTAKGIRKFDQKFMANVFEQPFETKIVSLDLVPQSNEISQPIGRHLDGCRIGFDAGGSDRKVSAVIDGKSVYSEEIVWHPKINSDPSYHFKGIMDSLNRAASKLPKIDAIGVSSAGIFINNRVAVASLFRQVPQDLFDNEVRDMYLKIQKIFKDVPMQVVNDGDVTALAGSMSLNSNNILGIAMGTSEAAGYVDKFGNITGWLNELSFVPVDINKKSAVEEWSEDYGVGSLYFSQDAVIRLCKTAKIELDESSTPAEKLKIVQELAKNEDERALEVFRTIGVYLGYTIAYYSRFYDIKHVLILGRVTSGIGGTLIIREAKLIIKNNFEDLHKKLSITLPDEKSRRVGQSIAAASLPKI